MNWTERCARFRAVLEGPACVHPGSVHDPISARIAEDLGFEVGMFAGSTGSLAVLGAPDLIVPTLAEFAQQALRINRAVATLPLLVDADHGYGNALNVQRTVEELEIAGVAVLTIEDTLLPRPYGATGTTQLVTVEEGVGKMRAALAGRLARGGRGRCAVPGGDDHPRATRFRGRCGVAAVAARQHARRMGRWRVPRRAGRTGGFAGPSPVRGVDPCYPRHAEGVAGWRQASRHHGRCIRGLAQAGHARRGLPPLDRGVPGLEHDPC